METHSKFFVQRWRQYSQRQCRLCELVVSEDNIENHMDSAHPSNLFADSDDLVKENVPGNNENQVDQNFTQDSKANLSKREEDQSEQLESSSSNIIESNQEHEFNGLNPTMFPPKHKLRLKPLDLLLDQSKIESHNNEASDYERKSVCSNFPPESVKSDKQNVFNPCHLVMQGIKKNVSEESIKNFFSEKGIRIIGVSTQNGSGSVIFKNTEDAAAWDGKVIQVDDCCIRTWIPRNCRAGDGENELKMSGISINVSKDDLYDFFWRKSCIVDNISLQNGHGKIIFRLREAAANWHGKLIVVKESQIKLWKEDPDLGRKLNIESDMSRSKEEGSGGCGLDREKCWRNRSRERKESRRRYRSRSREDQKKYRSRSKESRERHRNRSKESREKHRRRYKESRKGYSSRSKSRESIKDKRRLQERNSDNEERQVVINLTEVLEVANNNLVEKVEGEDRDIKAVSKLMAELEEEVETYYSEKETKKYENIQSRLSQITKQMKLLQPTRQANVSLKDQYNNRLAQLWTQFETRSDSLVEVLEQQMERNLQQRKDQEAIEKFREEMIQVVKTILQQFRDRFNDEKELFAFSKWVVDRRVLDEEVNEFTKNRTSWNNFTVTSSTKQQVEIYLRKKMPTYTKGEVYRRQ